MYEQVYSRGKYRYCWVHTSQLLGYLVHTCHVPIDIQKIYCSTQTRQHSCLLDISRQLACMKLGSRRKYQPVHYWWVHTSRLLGYLVHTCHFPDIQQIYCSTQTGQHSRLKRSIMLSSLGTATCMYTCYPTHAPQISECVDHQRETYYIYNTYFWPDQLESLLIDEPHTLSRNLGRPQQHKKNIKIFSWMYYTVYNSSSELYSVCKHRMQ